MPLAITTAIHDARAAGWRRAVFYSCDTAFPLEALPSTVPRAYDTTKSITVCAFKGIEWSSWNRGEGPTAASEYLKAGAPIGTTVTTTNFKGFVQRLDISVMSNSHAYGKNSCDFALALTGTQVVGRVAGRLVDWNFGRALLRVHGHLPRRPLAAQWIRRKIADLEKGDKVKVKWATCEEPTTVFSWDAEVTAVGDDGTVQVFYKATGDMETLPYVHESEFVLLDVILCNNNKE